MLTVIHKQQSNVTKNLENSISALMKLDFELDILRSNKI